VTRRLFLAAAVVLAGVYASVRIGVVPFVDAWSLVGADADGAIVWMSFATSNTGFLDDQLTTRVMVIPANLEIIEHRAQWGPAVLDDNGVSAGADSLRMTPQGWQARVGGEGLGARLEVPGAKPGCPPEVGRMAGIIEDSVDGRLVTGPAIVTRSHTEGWRPGAALYAFGADVSIGIDARSSCPAWVSAKDRVWTGEAIDFPISREVALVLGEWTVSFRAAQLGQVHDGWAHASAVERGIARVFGFHPPITELSRVVVRLERGGRTTLAPGLVVRWR
jgi:hypothetical protein